MKITYLAYVIILIFSFNSCYSQKNAIYLIVYGNKHYMEKTTNGREYTFKQGIKDGSWTAFYDKHHQDTAVKCMIVNGKINGEFIRWDKEKKYIIEKCDYVNGKMHGIRKTYLMIDGVLNENQYRYEDDVLMEYIKTEW